MVADSNVFTSAGIWSHGSSRVELLLNSIDNNKIIGRWINEERPEFEGELFGRNGTMTFPDDTTYIFSLDSTLKIIRWSNSGEWKLQSGSTLQKIIFDIEPLTGKVYLSQGTLDFEYRENYLISVLFSDSDIDNQKSVTRFISIRVKDVNEAPIFDGPVKREENIATYEFSVEEEIAQNQVVRLGTWIERGGYRDTSSRALRHGPHAYGYTAASCQKACHNWNGISYKYFALQDNGWCCCDNDWKEVTKYGKKSCGKTGGGWCNYVYESSAHLDKSSIGKVKVLEVKYGHNCDIATYSHMPTPLQNCDESHKLGWYVAYNAGYKLSMCKALCDENEKCNHFSYNPNGACSLYQNCTPNILGNE